MLDYEREDILWVLLDSIMNSVCLKAKFGLPRDACVNTMAIFAAML